jgi:hypothetical protein
MCILQVMSPLQVEETCLSPLAAFFQNHHAVFFVEESLEEVLVVNDNARSCSSVWIPEQQRFISKAASMDCLQSSASSTRSKKKTKKQQSLKKTKQQRSSSRRRTENKKKNKWVDKWNAYDEDHDVCPILPIHHRSLSGTPTISDLSDTTTKDMSPPHPRIPATTPGRMRMRPEDIDNLVKVLDNAEEILKDNYHNVTWDTTDDNSSQRNKDRSRAEAVRKTAKMA